MRVLVVTHAYPRWDHDVAGAFIEGLCRALVERGHAIEVLAPSDQGAGGREERHGIVVERLRYGTPAEETLAYRGTMPEAARSLAGLWRFERLIAAFRRAIVERKESRPPDLVHAHWWLPGGIAAWRARAGGGLPYVVTVHGTDVALLYRSALARAVGRRVLGRAAGVTAVSRFLAAEAAAACGLDESGVVVQPMPIAPQPADLLVRSDRLDRPDRRGVGKGVDVVTVGRLTRQKRTGLFLRTVRCLLDADVPVSATIVGDGPERRPLADLADELGIADRVRFAGAVAPGEVVQYLDQSDVFLFPAEREGFGLAAVEALIRGLPVVACTDGGGVRDIVGGGGGVLAAPEPAALAEAVRAVVRHAGVRHEALAAGMEWRRRLEPRAAAVAFEGVYERALAGTRGP